MGGVDTQGRDPNSNHVRSEYTSELGQTRGLLGGWLVMFELWNGVEWSGGVEWVEWWNGWWSRSWNSIMDGGGIFEWWNHGMEWNGCWWLVMVEWWSGGCIQSCLCVSFSDVSVMILSLSYAGVHQDHHDHGWPCARTIVFDQKLMPDLSFSKRKDMSRVHENHGCRAAP